MLDVMRKANAKKWFLYILILPVVFSFVLAIFAIWGGAANISRQTGTDWAAKVDGVAITVRQVQVHRQQVEEQMRRQLGDQYDAVVGSVNLDQMALGQLLGQSLAYAEGVRLGLDATPREIGDAIVNAPMFQRNGRFIGRDQYMDELRRRGYDVAEYERQVGKDLTVDKVRELVGTMVNVSDAEAQQAYRDEGESAEVDYVLLKASDFPTSGDPSAKEIEAYFRDHRSGYLTPEKRRANYVVIEREPLLKAVQPTDAEIQDYYDKNKDTFFTNPEQRRASHILLKIPQEAAGPEVEAIESKAKGLLAQIRAGGDFASIARTNSEDSSAAQGGDLGWFGRGRMVPEFEKAAFALSDGQVSDIVRTQFGFHIIKMTGSRPAGAQPLDEVRDRIKQQLSFSKAQEQLQDKAQQFSTKLGQQVSSFEGTSAEMGYTVKDTGFVAKGQPVGELGPAPAVADEMFRLKAGDTSGAITAPQGIVFVRLTETKTPEPAPFESVKDQVKAEMIKSRSIERARAAARDLAAAAAGAGGGLKEAADKKKLQLQTTGDFTRATAPATFNDEIKEAIFSHKANDLVGPIESPEGVVLVKIIKRGPATEEETGRLKGLLRDRLLQRRRDDAFGALLQRLQRAASIEYNNEYLSGLTRRASS